MQLNTTNQATPTLYDYMGGMDAFIMLTEAFYKKVHADAILAPVFAHAPADHHIHVAHFIAEVFGGPPTYSETDGGSHAGMIAKHLEKHLTETQRRQWVNLLLDTADDVSLPDDPEFRSAFVAYIEWGTRVAVITSNATDAGINPEEPMPKWGWGVPGGPYVANRVVMPTTD